MYYSGNFIPFQMVSNQYGYNDFYMFNQNHVEVDFATKQNKLFQYDPAYYYADGYRAVRVNNTFVSAHHNISRTIKSKNPKSEWCSNCNNETLRRKNEEAIENRPQVALGDGKYSNTLSKKDKMEKAKAKTATFNKNFRSKSINTLLDKTNDSQVKSDEVCDKKERCSRIDKFENKIEHKILTEASKDEEKQNKEPMIARNLAPPPPPAPPLPLGLNFSKPNLILNRTNKVIKSVVGDADTTKSFDAVVNELKFRLKKIKPPEENENLSEKIPKLILTERRKIDEPHRKPNETKSDLNEIDSGIQSTDTISKKLQINSNSSLSSTPSHPSAKQNSLSRLKSSSKSSFGVVGIFKKNKLSPSFEQTSFYTDSNASRMSLAKQSENRTDLSSLSDFTDSIKCETMNDFAVQPSSSFKRSSTQNLNSKGKKVIFETVNTEPSPDKNGKKILKRNTFSEAKNQKDSSDLKQVERPLMNRLVKSKSDYMNTNKVDRESHSCYDNLDLIKIESLGDLSNKQNLIAAFSTKNFFQNERSKELDGSKVESSVKIDREFKKKLHVPYASSTLKSKSEIKINKAKQMSAVRPIAKSVFSTCTLNPNQFKANSESLAEEPQNNKVFNQIPSKYSSFVDLKKNKNLNMAQKNFNSLNRKNNSDLCENLINKASEYGIQLPDLLGRLKQNYQIGNECLNPNEKIRQYGVMNGIESFNQYSISSFNEQYEEFDQYLDLMSSF
ncbi:hypothetical protein BpHYR1_028132 [Brachionus plicatilis]|uniref:Uncharacterized protein n=1 Tax=Brachionus plicatilis TaxID=10195 RepID=A0A3M7PN26_BRAPC|nr:hypothetical protein BpHYR1_028132 [Brachionus plicatilis]